MGWNSERPHRTIMVTRVLLVIAENVEFAEVNRTKETEGFEARSEPCSLDHRLEIPTTVVWK